jgi:tetraacyldisaccharide 4'-kinase
MKTPAFWSEDGTLARLLTPISFVWGAIAARRMTQAPRGAAPVPVIAIGNFTAGGAGKTPTVAALVRIARAAGLSPAVVSRGHGGSETGPVRVDPEHHSAIDVGDEPLLLARLAPTIVARDRLTGAWTAAELGADLVLLDDGFQNPALARDYAVVVVDRGQGLGNGRVMPAGPLRAPLDVQFSRADALVVVDSGEVSVRSSKQAIAKAENRQMPIFRARLVARDPGLVAGRRVLAFAGIGRPEKFAATLRACGAEIVDLVAFGDHARLSEEEASALTARAEAAGAMLVTTAKDAARMAGETGPALARLARSVGVIDVDLVFDDENRVRDLLIGVRDRTVRGFGSRRVAGRLR